MPNLNGPLVVALLYDGLCTFEFGIVAEIFGLPRPEMGENWYRFASCAIEDGPLRAHGGLVVTPDFGPELVHKADIIVVPGWRGVDKPVPQSLIKMLRDAHEGGARLASICSGAFVLAATGLLDGATATTHWRYADALRSRHANILVDDASLYRTHERIYTSAGSAAGIDLLIEIVRQDFGTEAANSVARRLVMPAHRSGGQAQFLERPVPAAHQSAVAPLLDRIRSDLKASWTLERMAAECGMSLRTFVRRFTEATGTSPGEWLVGERIEAAKSFLIARRLSIDEIAAAVGIGSADTLRHHFKKRIGLSPKAYQDQFSSLRGP
ncbi:transcriptional regulator FtrA [Rhizobiales bacterium RZME27]|jgi:AraC family transcriptional activator FtrA|uniref:Transcriptional regulator FtrA n=1 Tax=Endobacterium cereale TaxID=2663029 RepID=A0A6A8A103_9HYPH|nr:transcriptional regulator FtrA [Endobacterium cereale]MEB2846667.1 transcriptional regulator FtrA [Endobacterium cereale]MQY44482.1 transcriptional regulator FtrA [Endobacterium cereale]